MRPGRRIPSRRPARPDAAPTGRQRLPAGNAALRIQENPTNLVGSGRMRGLLGRIRHEYDCVLLDAPPVLPVTDAIVLARDADAVVLIVHAGSTPAGVVKRARDRLAIAGARVAGVILNQVAAA